MTDQNSSEVLSTPTKQKTEIALNNETAYNDGSKYEGDFSNGKKEGKGTYTWGKFSKYPGYKYTGDWKEDKKEGKGTYFYPNGDIQYEGDFVNDQFEGNGKFIYQDKSCYEGQWKNK